MPELGMPTDLEGLLAEAEQVQRRLVETQAELARQEVSGSAGSGLVTARVNGTGELTSLSIDPRILRAGDPARTAQAVADLVLAAVRHAERAAAELREAAMAPFGDPLLGLELDRNTPSDGDGSDGDGSDAEAPTSQREPEDPNVVDSDTSGGVSRGAPSLRDDDPSARDNECMEHPVGESASGGIGSPHGEIEPFPSRANLRRVPGRAAS